jgi:hypothetical protein
MAKVKKNRPGTTNYETLIPPQYHHAAALGFLLLLIVFFFRDLIFGGMVFLSPDFVSPHSFSTLVEDARREGIFPLWNPYIFCGMPAYGSLTVSGDRLFDITSVILETTTRGVTILFLNAQYGWAFFYYFILGAGMYALTLRKVGQKLPALIAAIGTVFSMYIIIWVMIGHGTKVGTMAFFPLMIFFVERLRDRWNLLDAALLAIALHFSLNAGHVQMIFYIFFTFGIYFVFFLFRDLIKKSETLKGTLRAGATFAAAALLAAAMVSDKYLSVLEYNPYSIRGSAPITATSASESATPEGGLDYEYATNWSFSPGEMITFLIPSWYGFGWNIYQGPLSNNQPVRANTYFGQMPFTDAPQYMGIVILVFAIIGLVRFRKEPFVQFAALVTILSLLISFGRTFSLLYDLMFFHFPFFNRFRAPSMILVLVQIMIPLLAAYGIKSFIEDARTAGAPHLLKRWQYVLGSLAVITLVGLVWRSFFTNLYGFFMSPEETTRLIAARIGNVQVAKELYRFIANAIATDILYAALFLLAVLGALYLHIRGMLKFRTAAGIIIVVVIADLWRIATQPMELHERRQQDELFTPTNVIKYLQSDSTLFRILEFENGQPPYSNSYAYWRIQSAYGYQGAKMRSYQDMVDVVGLRNPLLWQLMNVKYIITNQPDSAAFLGLAYDDGQKKVYVNRLVYPRAFFVNRYEVASGLAILNKIKNMEFNPREVAYVMDDPKLTIEPPLPTNRAEFVRYGIQDFQMVVSASGTNLLFISETYYPKGWKAYLDGKEIPIYRLNYLFRGVVIPPGTHTLIMKFEPESFVLGKTISLTANILLLMLVAYAGFDVWKKKKSEPR